MTTFPLVYSESVNAAKREGRAIVALESTILTHGFVYPHNLEIALETESIIRAQGAEPATIALIEGQVHIGLTEAQVTQLVKRPGVRKVTTRDIGWVVSQGGWGGTTVAATMCLAHRAGIAVFATGAMGGVHRGATESFDISADLTQLAMTPVAVVCSGAKSLLDLALTLEYLETHSVPVVGYQTDEFPAFFSRDSGLALENRLDTPEAMAAFLRIQWQVAQTGVVVANPIPEAFNIPAAEIEPAIQAALAEANRRGIHGKAITPFLLNHIRDITAGRSAEANRALMYHNARVGAQVAVELQKGKQHA